MIYSPKWYFLNIFHQGWALNLLSFSEPIVCDEGWYREIPMIYLSGAVARLKRENDSEAGLSLEDIKNRIYLSRPDATEEFDFAGEQVVAGRSWLRINFLPF